MKNEIMELSQDLNVITAEIKSYQNIAGQSLFEIGRRLKAVRENPDKYGFEGFRDWERWCKNEVDMSRRYANDLIQVYEQFGESSGLPARIATWKLFEIACLPSEVDRQEFIEKSHEVPSTGETKTVDEMTKRELREVKKALKQAQSEGITYQESIVILRKEKAEADADKKRLEALLKAEQSKKTPQVEVVTEVVKEVVKEDVVERDTQAESELRSTAEALRSQSEELARYKSQYGELYENGDTVRRSRSNEERINHYTDFVEALNEVRRKFSDIQFEGEQFKHFAAYQDNKEIREDFYSFETFFEQFVKGIVGETESIIIDAE